MAAAILVVGGAGYIGSHVCKVLASHGFTPVVLDDLSAGHADSVRWGPLITSCVSQEEVVAQVIKEHHIEAVIDLAGVIEVAESVANPLKYYQQNIAVKLPFLRAIIAAGVKAIVFSSSAAVYGEPTGPLIPETHPLAPQNPYGHTKAMYEQILRDMERSDGLKWMALRYFNAAGASLEGEIGERHEPESHLIPRACMAQLGKIPMLEVFGNDYPTPDGTAIRDYIHVVDLAMAHVLAVKALLGGSDSAAYNVGTGTGTSIGEVLSTFEKLGWPVPHALKPRRAGDCARLVADSTRVKEALGWVPVHSDITTIIRTAYMWHQKS